MADRLDEITSGDALVVQVREESLATQTPFHFGRMPPMVPVHVAAPEGRTSGLFGDPKTSA